jgi:outer membrane protein TolC
VDLAEVKLEVAASTITAYYSLHKRKTNLSPTQWSEARARDIRVLQLQTDIFGRNISAKDSDRQC